MIFVSDLDNTLIHSYKHAAEHDICIELRNGKQLSFMTPKAHNLLQEINKRCTFIPVTTRSLEQYKRINMLQGQVPPYALVSNGAILLIDDAMDVKWYNESKEMIADLRPAMFDYKKLLESDTNISFEIRLVDDVFVFTKSIDPEATIALLNKQVNQEKFKIYNLKEKIYIIPNILNKGAALNRLKARLGSEHMIGAGDSILDLPMLFVVDKAIVPHDFFYCNDRFVWAEKDSFSEFILDYILANTNSIKIY